MLHQFLVPDLFLKVQSDVGESDLFVIHTFIYVHRTAREQRVKEAAVVFRNVPAASVAYAEPGYDKAVVIDQRKEGDRDAESLAVIR